MFEPRVGAMLQDRSRRRSGQEGEKRRDRETRPSSRSAETGESAKDREGLAATASEPIDGEAVRCRAVRPNGLAISGRPRAGALHRRVSRLIGFIPG